MPWTFRLLYFVGLFLIGFNPEFSNLFQAADREIQNIVLAYHHNTKGDFKDSEYYP